MERTFFRQQTKDEPPHRPDALWQPQADGRRRGSTTRRTIERSTYTRARLSGAARVLPAIAIGVLVAGALRSRRHAG